MPEYTFCLLHLLLVTDESYQTYRIEFALSLCLVKVLSPSIINTEAIDNNQPG